MATKSEIERLSVVETKVDTIIDSLKDVNKKLDNLDKKFAAKWVQTVVAGLIAAILLGFIAVVVNFFIPNKPLQTSANPTTSQTAGGSSGTPSANASAASHSDTATPSDSQTSTSNGGVNVTLPKVTP